MLMNLRQQIRSPTKSSVEVRNNSARLMLLNGSKVKPATEAEMDNFSVENLRKACCEKSTIATDMQHSYSRDCRPIEGANGLTTRTLMVQKPPQCPSCHTHPTDETTDLDEANHPPIPTYHEAAAKESMNESTKVANSFQSLNSDDKNWEESVNKFGWLPVQQRLFSRICRILDFDYLARMANVGRTHEPVQRRVIIDKSVQRMRMALGSVSWESRWTQWVHGLLMEHLSPAYMASYLDILQTLNSKHPSLMDKMLTGRPMIGVVLKKQWEPLVTTKSRKLPGNSVIVLVPSNAAAVLSSRLLKWLQLFATMTQIVQVSLNATGNSKSSLNKLPLHDLAEHIVTMTRLKVRELRHEHPQRSIILLGFNAGSTLALQVALSETVNSIICLGFAYNTMSGVRGAPDDRITDITTPVMFVIGQNSAKTSHEEMETLREKMLSKTSLVVVGSADDSLRVPKSKRQIENVTQAMVDNMVADEIHEFIRNCIINPPRPRHINNNIGSTSAATGSVSQVKRINNTAMVKPASPMHQRKRKISESDTESGVASMKVTKFAPGRPSLATPRSRTTKSKIQPLYSSTSAASHKQTHSQSASISSLPRNVLTSEKEKFIPKKEEMDEEEILQTFEILTQPKMEIRRTNSASMVTSNSLSGKNIVASSHSLGNRTMSTPTPKLKMIPANQFLQLKAPSEPNTQKIYTIKKSVPAKSPTSTSTEHFKPGQVFTVKSTSLGSNQFAPNTTISSQLVLNSQKFTVLKSGTAIVGTTSESTGTTTKLTTSKADIASIFDMPIIFADNDGNLHDSAPKAAVTSTATSSNSPIIITQSQLNELNQSGANKNIIVSGIGQKPKTTNKVVYINRSSMKPVPNLLTKSLPPLKYTKLIVTNPNKVSSTPLLAMKRSNTIPSSVTETQKTFTVVQKPKAIELAQPTTQIVRRATLTQIAPIRQQQSQTQTATAVSAAQNSQPNKPFPIVIGVDSDKTTFTNVIRVGETQIKPRIVLKTSAGFRTVPHILNRDVTVRKIIQPHYTQPQSTDSNAANNFAGVVTSSAAGTRHYVVSQSGSRSK